MTYSSVGARHCPCSATTRTLSAAIHPDIEVLVTVAGVSVPVATSVVVRHVGDIQAVGVIRDGCGLVLVGD